MNKIQYKALHRMYRVLRKDMLPSDIVFLTHNIACPQLGTAFVNLVIKPNWRGDKLDINNYDDKTVPLLTHLKKRRDTESMLLRVIKEALNNE